MGAVIEETLSGELNSSGENNLEENNMIEDVMDTNDTMDIASDTYNTSIGMNADMDMAMDNPSEGGFKLSNNVILGIIIGVCAVIGIVLGIIFGRRSANK